MNLEELAAAGGSAQPPAVSFPAGWQPSVTYDASGRAEVVAVGPGTPSAYEEWEADVRALGVELPPGMTVRLTEIRHDPAAWVRRGQGLDAETESITRRRYVVEPVQAALEPSNVDDLLAAIGRKRPKPAEVTTGGSIVIAVADLQLGESDHAGGTFTEDTVIALMSAVDQAITQAKQAVKRGNASEIVVAFLGDCVQQGHLSQGGRLAWRQDLTLTEQVRVYRRLALEIVKAAAALGVPVQVPVVGGNHGIAVRSVETRYDDSWDVEAVVSVADALDLAGGYEHVTFTFPALDDDMATIAMGDGTVITCAHGHQWTGPASNAGKWWAGQALGRTTHTGDILLAGHRHHLYVEDVGGRWVVSAPAMVGPSAWWTRKTGQRSRRGLLTLEVADHTIRDWRLL